MTRRLGKDAAVKVTQFDSGKWSQQLASSGVFGGVNLELIQPTLNECQLRDMVVGDVLLDPRKPNEQLHIVVSGELWVCLEADGTDPLLRLGPGQCAGELSIMDASPPAAYVFASQSSQVVSISNGLLWSMIDTQQKVAANLLRIIAQRVRDSNHVITESLALQRRYRSKAETDQLTGLHNRAWFEEVFPKQLHLCERTRQAVSLLILDIDHFKKVNDTYGHTCGDEALRHIAKVLVGNVRSTDLTARYGGEEIVVLMPGTAASQALEVSDRLREALVAAPMQLGGGGSLDLRMSGGIAQWRSGMLFEDLINEADQALYKAKQSGRNRIMLSPLAIPPIA